MIRKLRVQFVRIALLALSLAMLLVSAVINGANWLSVRAELTETATLIAENDGFYPNERRGKGRHLGREAVYETRYFSVLCLGEGEYMAANMASIATVTEAEAFALAERAQASGQTAGFLGDYLFRLAERGGHTLVVFLDCETKLTACKTLALFSAAACVAGILLSLGLVSLLSRRAIAPIIESNDRQKRFITDAGHELKTPLTVISANMDILAMDVGENEWVEGTRRQLAQMGRLVNDLVTLSKMDEEDAPLDMQRFDLSAAVCEAAEGFTAMAECRAKTLRMEIEPAIHMNGDEGALRRLTAILVDNAVKYAPADDEILVSLRQEGKRARLATRNRLAEPLEEATLARLFDRFYRADPSRAKEAGQGGYGVGLAIAKAVAERHGGRIRARAADGCIEFVCLLPIVK